MGLLDKDKANLDELLNLVKQQGTDYLSRIDERPTCTQSQVDFDKDLKVDGLGAIETLNEFNNRFEPLMVASSGPRYWGFVTGGTTPAAIAG
ncbi:MAG: aspartate aminotransferase family protein, partial [Sphingobacteriales bacterium]